MGITACRELEREMMSRGLCTCAELKRGKFERRLVTNLQSDGPELNLEPPILILMESEKPGDWSLRKR
jgi:hypothetical protein